MSTTFQVLLDAGFDPDYLSGLSDSMRSRLAAQFGLDDGSNYSAPSYAPPPAPPHTGFQALLNAGVDQDYLLGLSPEMRSRHAAQFGLDTNLDYSAPPNLQADFAAREAARIEAAIQASPSQVEARLEAERQEAARIAAEREAAVQEAIRQEVARQEAARIEAARQEEARVEAQRAAAAEAARVEAARVEAIRQEQIRAQQLADQQEAARQEAARVEAARVEAQRIETARQQALAAEQAERQRVQNLTNERQNLFREIYGREGSPDEIQAVLDMPVDQVRSTLQKAYTDWLKTQQPVTPEPAPVQAPVV